MEENPAYHIDLIARYLSGEAGEDDLFFLAEWLKSDPKNREIFKEYCKTWFIIEKEQADARIDVDAEWKRLEMKITGTIYGRSVRIRSITSSRLIRIAAVIVLVAIPAFFLYRYLSNPVLKQLEATSSIVDGQLPDGTAVILNAGSSLEYPARFKGNSRTVTLKGEALFEVVPDKTKPFIVSVGNVRVKVLGTAFYVNTNAKGGKIEVILQTGKVSVYYNEITTEEVTLDPGEKAEINPSKQEISIGANDDENFMAWKTGKLVFTNEAFIEIVETLNKVYRSNILLTNTRLGNCRVTVTFEKQSLESVLNVLKETLNLEISHTGSVIGISGRGCE